VNPERALDVETVDGEPAATSRWRFLFDDFDATRDAAGGLRLRRRYGASPAEAAEPDEGIAPHPRSTALGSLSHERNQPG
jgi:hypothetical protein